MRVEQDLLLVGGQFETEPVDLVFFLICEPSQSRWWIDVVPLCAGLLPRACVGGSDHGVRPSEQSLRFGWAPPSPGHLWSWCQHWHLHWRKLLLLLASKGKGRGESKRVQVVSLLLEAC